MFRIIAFTLLVVAQVSVGSAAVTCSGADPAITSVAVTSTTSDDRVNRYHLSGKVVNMGRMGQASNVLQSVDIYEGQNKADTKSIPPLKPGQSYMFSYVYVRSSDAGAGTSNLTFQLRARKPSPPGSQNCSTSNDRYVLTL